MPRLIKQRKENRKRRNNQMRPGNRTVKFHKGYLVQILAPKNMSNKEIKKTLLIRARSRNFIGANEDVFDVEPVTQSRCWLAGSASDFKEAKGIAQVSASNSPSFINVLLSIIEKGIRVATDPSFGQYPKEQKNQSVFFPLMDAAIRRCAKTKKGT